MEDMGFTSVLIKMFFLLTPFFALSMFLSYTEDYTPQRRRATAVRTTLAVAIICLIIYWFGEYLFRFLGITVDAFRIGAGVVLMLTSIGLVNGSGAGGKHVDGEVLDVTVVPLAIPCIVGPGTIGALLVLGAEGGALGTRLEVSGGIVAGVLIVGLFLLLAEQIEKLLKRNGIQILSKITGLMLAALSAQIIFTGIRNLLR